MRVVPTALIRAGMHKKSAPGRLLSRIAFAHAGSGDLDRALAEVEDAVEAGYDSFEVIEGNALLVPLREGTAASAPSSIATADRSSPSTGSRRCPF